MIKKIFILLSLFIIVAINSYALEDFSPSNLISVGETFPNIKLSAPLIKEDAKYLGIKDKQDFFISEIRADLVLVEILNTFCFSCQKQAPVYNELFQRIQSNPNTKDKIKMIGIAVGNTREAIEEFRSKYDVKFPIIPDEDYKVYEAIGGARTPFSIFLRKNDDFPNGIVVKTHLGVSYRYDIIYQDMLAMLTMDKNSLLNIAKKETKEGYSQVVKPIFTTEQAIEFLRSSLKDEGYILKNVEKIDLPNYLGLFHIKIDEKGEEKSLVAHMVSKPPTCGICHDIHFIYTFDSDGKIKGFYPIQLTKYGNVPWSTDDINKFKGEILGKYISRPWAHKSDAKIVSSATITTSVMFHNLSKGERLFKALKEKNII